MNHQYLVFQIDFFQYEFTISLYCAEDKTQWSGVLFAWGKSSGNAQGLTGSVLTCHSWWFIGPYVMLRFKHTRSATYKVRALSLVLFFCSQWSYFYILKIHISHTPCFTFCHLNICHISCINDIYNIIYLSKTIVYKHLFLYFPN